MQSSASEIVLVFAFLFMLSSQDVSSRRKIPALLLTTGTQLLSSMMQALQKYLLHDWMRRGTFIHNGKHWTES